jgi:hypothetical protein
MANDAAGIANREDCFGQKHLGSKIVNGEDGWHLSTQPPEIAWDQGPLPIIGVNEIGGPVSICPRAIFAAA